MRGMEERLIDRFLQIEPGSSVLGLLSAGRGCHRRHLLCWNGGSIGFACSRDSCLLLLLALQLLLQTLEF